MSGAATVLARCERLGGISEAEGALVRRFATPALREASNAVGGWMRDAGLDVREDAVGNVIGRREGSSPGAPALMLGSHIDTVRDAGRYDGPLGVLAAIAVVERLRDRALPFAVEVTAFADEEGTRYGTAFLGSSAVTGRFDPGWLALVDADGVALADALRAYGGDPEGIAGAARSPSELLGYCELHIEQGPVLERLGAPVGVVTAIAGQSHAWVRFTGEAGHAGGLPMADRRDALAAAAQLVLVAEALARGRDDLVATVGELSVRPGARNVVPGAAELSLDVRSRDDAVRREAFAALRGAAGEIGAARGVAVAWEDRGDVAAVPLEGAFAELLAAAAGVDAPRLASGAGHDAAAMAAIVPAAMLFVRCRGGVSHHPAEHVEEADVAVALDVLERFVLGLARDVSPGGAR